MNRETLNSAMLLLQAKVTEQYGVIKDAVRRPSEMGDMEKLASMALQLANLEQGLAALQTYGADLVREMESVNLESASTPVEAEEEDDDEEETEPKRITPEMSSTFKRVADIHARQKELKQQEEE